MNPGSPNKIKVYAKKRLPAPWLVAAKLPRSAKDLIPAYIYDLARYWRYSSTLGPTRHQENLRAAITERYHSIEKGLSLTAPRPAFGAQAIAGLLDNVDIYIEKFGYDELISTVEGVLLSYLKFNYSLNVSETDIPQHQRLQRLAQRATQYPTGAGVRQFTKAEVVKSTDSVTLEFFDTRRSVRQYSSDPVLRHEIEIATQIALKAPAVCNRQFARVYSYTEKQRIAELLKIQGGAAGFSEELTGLAIITTNLRSYWNSGQRNQAWVDGGLFAMNFLHGLHTQNIGSVCLNWSKPPSTDQLLRRAARIGQDEAIIMLVGFGKLREQYKVAASVRRSVESVLRFNDHEIAFRDQPIHRRVPE